MYGSGLSLAGPVYDTHPPVDLKTMKFPSSETAGSKQSRGAYWGNEGKTKTFVRLKISPVRRSFRKTSRIVLLSLAVMTFEEDVNTTHRPLWEMAGSKQPASGWVLARLSDARTVIWFAWSPFPTSSRQHGSTRTAATSPAVRRIWFKDLIRPPRTRS